MTSSISHYSASLNANDQGIALLKQSRYTDAISIFRTGLHAIHTASHHDKVNHQGKGTRIMNAPYSRAYAQDKKRIVLSQPVLQEARDGDEDTFLAFNRALTIPHEMVFFLKAEDLKYLTSAILFYNIGLSLHLEARRMGDSQLLKQAVHFYERSYQLLRAQALIGQPHFSMLAAMAILNNIGSIHAYFCRFYETSIFRHHLSSLLTVEQRKCANELCASLVDEESEIFIQNCVLFSDWQLLVASAA